jgi:hypothetical protein
MAAGQRHQVVTVDAPEVAGSIANETARKACVVLPASYASARARRYPVIYDFPGWGETGGPLPWLLGLLRAEDASGGAGIWASYAADWSPDPSARRGFVWPVDPATGRVRPRVLARWRAHGPQAWLTDPRRAAAIQAAFAGRIYLDAGANDEFSLHETTLAFSRALARAGVTHRFETVPGGHMDRIPALIGPPLRFCLERLAAAR